MTLTKESIVFECQHRRSFGASLSPQCPGIKSRIWHFVLLRVRFRLAVCSHLVDAPEFFSPNHSP